MGYIILFVWIFCTQITAIFVETFPYFAMIIDNNRLSGTIPVEFALLSSLEDLSLGMLYSSIFSISQFRV